MFPKEFADIFTEISRTEHNITVQMNHIKNKQGENLTYCFVHNPGLNAWEIRPMQGSKALELDGTYTNLTSAGRALYLHGCKRQEINKMTTEELVALRERNNKEHKRLTSNEGI